MLSWKFFFISITLVLINLLYSAAKIYQPDLFDTMAGSFSDEVIPLLVNTLFILLICLFFFSQKKKLRAKLDEMQSNQSIIPTRPGKAKGYSDVTLIDTIPNLFCIKDQNGRWLQASPKYLETLDLLFTDYMGKTDAYLALNSTGSNLVLQENMLQDKNAWQTKKAVKKELTITRENGDSIQLEFTTTPVYDKANQPFRLFITGQITKEMKNEANKTELLNSIFFTSHLCFIILDKALNISSANTAFTSLLGYSFEEVENQSISHLINANEKEGFHKEIEDYFQKNDFQLWSKDIECTKSDGEPIYAKFEIKPIRSKNDTFDNYFVTIDDITINKQRELHLSRIAHFDHLTGLVNRIMFLDRMAKFLSAAKRHKLHAVIFFIDLDKFKLVNDTLGHDAGDDVLKETAKRLLSVTRKEDVVARFSGDEFAILLLNEKSHEQAIFSASMIAKKIIHCLEQVFHVNRREVFVGSSIGISFFPEDGVSSEQLLKNADFAMYEAKNKGRNNYQFYKKEYGIATQDRLALENDLRKAITAHELQLFYQPQYNARNREISGAEVLIRWFKQESYGKDSYGKTTLIPPDQFIPLAEETGLIIPIGEWILETACAQMKDWLKQGFALSQVSVNVSARQFMDDGFMQSVEDALAAADLDPQHLELEITESMLIGDVNRIELQLKRLKAMGIKIALDDFGTGYSSLSYLKKFPIDILKIDQSFIREMTVGSKDASIASAIIEMGHSLNQKIVAEGVENETQLMLLTQQQCDYIQGYYFSRPLPVHKMTLLLMEENAKDSPINNQ